MTFLNRGVWFSCFFAVVLVLSGTSMALEDGSIVSDTGLLQGNNNCLNRSVEVEAVNFSRDTFDFLMVRVDIAYRCVDRSGRIAIGRVSDEVVFPTLNFDWFEQGWVQGGHVYARLDPLGFPRLTDEVSYEVDLDMQDHFITFAVLLAKTP